MVPEKIIEMTFPYSDKREKRVRVFVPEHEEGETMPVVYMTDGQNLFDDDNVRFGCWYTRESVRAIKSISGKSAVIVGIHNDGAPIERANELTPASIGDLIVTPDMPEEIKKQLCASGEVFDGFVINTLMPAVEKQFPVKTGRENTAFCGSSSGGLESFYIVMSHPDIFSAGGVFSPVFMVYERNSLRKWIISKMQGIKELPYLYFYAGGADDMEKQIASDTELVCDILGEHYPTDLLNKIFLPDKPHHESAWETTFYDFLRIFLSDNYNKQ